MSTFTFLNPIFRVLHTAYHIARNLINVWRAYLRKQRSMRALQRLDDYLLDDIGLQREDHKIVPIRVAPIKKGQLYAVQESQLRTRARVQKRVRARQSLLRSRKE